jgi:DNA-binding transcriptional ArsR family regulator
MDVGEPTQVTTPTLDGPVLTVLARAGEGLTPGEVHRRCRRGSEPGVRRTLARLVAQGIVLARPAGNAVLYSLNREHLAAPLVVQLVDLRPALWARLRDYLAAWEVPALHVSAFGSAARGDGDERSDIDLLVVRPQTTGSDESRWEAQIDDLRQRVRAWTGNRAQIVELDRDELRRATARGERLVGEVRRDGIGLMGDPFASLAPERRARRRREVNR